MRRSNSASSIPLPTSLQNRRESRETQRSSIAKGKENPHRMFARRDHSSESRTPDVLYAKRDPSLENYTPAYKRNPFGSDRKFSNQKRSASLSSYGSRSSGIARMTRSPGTKNIMQQQMNDKKWVDENFKKIQEYIRTSGNFDPELSRHIRPPTLANFVLIISDLLNQIFKNVHLNLHNYGDIVIQNLKLLRYPCQVNSSTLKTINTKHAFPHFVSILSWLIDKGNTEGALNAFINEKDEEIRISILIDQNIIEFMSILVPSESEEAPDQAKLEEQLYNETAAIIGADKEKAIKAEEVLNDARKEVETVQNELQKFDDQIAHILSENSRKMQIVKQYEESGRNRESKLKKEIEQLNENVAKHAEDRANVLKSIKKLEESIANQVCTHIEKLEMLKEIEGLKRSKERIERQIAEFWKMREDIDHKRSTLVREIENKVDEWNVGIVKSFLPELINLELPAKGFSSQQFLEKITEGRKQIGQLQEILFKEYENNLRELENLEKQKNKLFESKIVINSTKKRLNRLKESVHKLEDEQKQLKMDTEIFQNYHKNSINKITDFGNSKQEECRSLTEVLTKDIDKIKKEIYNTVKEGIEICAREQNNVLQTARQVEDVHQMALKEAGCQYITSQNEAERILHVVEELTEANALFN